MRKQDVIFGLMAALFLAFLLSLFASSWPDGLEKVAQDKGFSNKSEVEGILKSPVPDYIFPGIRNRRLAISVSGVLGTFLVFGLGYAAGVMLKKRKK